VKHSAESRGEKFGSIRQTWNASADFDFVIPDAPEKKKRKRVRRLLDASLHRHLIGGGFGAWHHLYDVAMSKSRDGAR
jgi:hypothetical protein